MSDQTFGAQLKRERLARGLTLYRLDKDGLIDKATISRLEHGTRFPSPEMVARLADILGLEPGSADWDRLYLLSGHIPPGVPIERLLLTCQMARRAE